MSTITDQINSAANATAQYQAATQTKTTGSAQQLGSQDFLNLMMKQLQYQDPMDPVSNTEFIAQQAQFSQLQTTNTMSDNIASNNGVSQALSLVGQKVSLTDPNNKDNTITGVVSDASLNGKNSSITVNGKSYPISSVKSVIDPYATPTISNNSNSSNQP